MMMWPRNGQGMWVEWEPLRIHTHSGVDTQASGTTYCREDAGWGIWVGRHGDVGWRGEAANPRALLVGSSDIERGADRDGNQP